MKILGKILGYITLALGILLLFSYLLIYINGSLGENAFLPAEVVNIFEKYIFQWGALIIVGAMILTTMMKHSIVLTIIFAVLIGAVVIFMIVSYTKAGSEGAENVVNMLQMIKC